MSDRTALISLFMTNRNDVLGVGDSNMAEFPFTEYHLASGKTLLLANGGLQGNGIQGVTTYLPQFLSEAPTPPSVLLFYCPVTNDRLIANYPYPISRDQWINTAFNSIGASMQKYASMKLLLESCYLPTRAAAGQIDEPEVNAINGLIRTELAPQLSSEFPGRVWFCDTGGVGFCQDPNDPGWAYPPNMQPDGEHANWGFHPQRRNWHTYFLNQMGL